MTRIWNAPESFADEMVEGFIAANRRWVRGVFGGVVRSRPGAEGHVAVVIGGGSGHYPAFAGLVGSGLADGAAMGNLFASPSSQRVASVARAAHRGGGVLLSYGNYAGDVLNFTAAQDRLRADGIECMTVVVTDDVASAPAAESHKRRGIAGDLAVFRIAGSAAGAGLPLVEVAGLAQRANNRTRTFGVAFSGCTLPGAAEPLFAVVPGRMAVGLGIHGEPGIGMADVPSADGLAELLVQRLLTEVPAGAGLTVIPILNGLGSLKYEELFVLYRRVAQLLAEAGLTVRDPHVGEYCTSFDMAGASLTLFWPDEELLSLWDVDVDTPAYHHSLGSIALAEALDEERPEAAEIPPTDSESRNIAGLVQRAMTAIAATIDLHVDELGRMDAIAGDGDHGIGMQRGANAACDAANSADQAGAGARTTLMRAADAWADVAGGTSGALWGVMLSSLADRLGDLGAPDGAAVAQGVWDAVEAVQRYGKAQIGDKTLVDALVPFAAELAREVTSGASLAEAWKTAATSARLAAVSTADLTPRIGRARPHALASVGTPDPGAHSLALIVTAVATVLAERYTP